MENLKPHHVKNYQSYYATIKLFSHRGRVRKGGETATHKKSQNTFHVYFTIHSMRRKVHKKEEQQKVT